MVLFLLSLVFYSNASNMRYCGCVDVKPAVNCSFVTEFEDHIFVAMDAEAVLFIHDLVINYVKEKDQGMSFSSQASYFCRFFSCCCSTDRS